MAALEMVFEHDGEPAPNLGDKETGHRSILTSHKEDSSHGAGLHRPLMRSKPGPPNDADAQICQGP